MGDRTVKVNLTASVAGYIAGMEQAARKTNELGNSAQKLAAQKDALGSLGRPLLAIGAVAAAATALAIKSFADFDAQMAQVKTLSHATASEMSELSNAALTMGQAIGFSANEVADAETELVKAGVSVKDIMGGALKGALDLAAAGQIDVGQATEIASSAMVQFGLHGKDVTHIADLLAAGADKALGGVSDLGTALKYAGPVAASLGVSLDETVGVLAEFASNGILADQAGTSLRGMLSSLTSPSQVAQKVMDKYNITLFDSQGKFIGLAGAAGQLHDKLGGLTQAERSYALGQIFGNQQITAANILLKDGAAGVNKWTKAVNDQGFAAQQAAGKMDNLNGDLKKLSAAFESDLIRTGSAANGPLRTIAQTVTGLLKVFGDLPQPVQQTALALTAGTAAIGLFGGGALLAVPKVVALAGAMETVGHARMGAALTGITSFLTGPWGIALGIGATALAGGFLASVAETQAKVDEFTSSLDANTGAITENTKAVAVKQLRDNGAIAVANKLGVSLDLVTQASLGNKDAVAEIVAQEQKWQSSGKHTQAELTQHSIEWQNLASKIGLTSGSLAQSQKDQADTAKAMGKLKTAQDDLASATSAANAAIAANGASFDQSTAAGQANKIALDKVADTQKAVIDATQATTQSQYQTTAAWQQGRAELASVAAQMGLTGAAADAYVNEHLGKIPPTVNTLITTQDAQARASIADFKAFLASIPDQKIVTIITRSNLSDLNGAVSGNGRLGTSANGNLYSGGVAQAFDSGGFAPGIYSGGAPLYKFAEPETRWEAFISGKPGQEARNRKVWVEAGRRLGVGDAGSGGVGPITVTLAQKGGVDLLKYVDVSIQQNDQAKARRLKMG
ncbi:hypothetical protein ASE16_03495 [Leifsonia sp. Root227]|uniref:phage tail tape measure protein n=1 Tax=Leifsonia sp. Root227 TaxID=1736496 RepID=UPI0006FB30A1|nr:phage tail tape measure protein [Leifsonia sp. Root227]KRC52125.1 hypothetical protein ASE16_03495 [Leifsonia sp. Root227]